MTHDRSGVTRPGGSRRVAAGRRWAAAVVLAGHGLVHLMGAVLLWRIAQPGDLRYADAVPRPGSPAAVVTGAVWLSAAVLFVAAAVLVAVRHPRWAPVAVLATALSVPVLASMASATRVGLAVDVVVLLTVLLTVVAGRRRERTT